MKRICKKQLIFSVLLIFVFASIILSLNAGYSKLQFWKIIQSLFGVGDSETYLIIHKLRLPRILSGLLCGAGLGLSGCIFQSVTRNPLADPGILGINAGAGIAVLIFMVFFPQLQVDSMIFMPLFAFVGGMLVALFFYAFAFRNGRLSNTCFLLGGIGAAAGIQATMLIMSTGLENSNFQMLSRWLVGSVYGTNWRHVFTLLPYLFILIPIALSRAGNMDVLVLGDELATGLGLKVERERRLLLFLAVALSAACIAVCGGLYFVGLVSPHIAKRIFSAKHHFILPASALIGMLICVMADSVGRAITQSVELPVGIIVSVISAPYFLYLLRKQTI